MINWQNIKKEWSIGDNFPLTPERVLSAFTVIREEFGNAWFEDRKRTGLGKSLIVLDAVRFAESFVASKTAELSELTKKLKLPWESEEFHQALSEADVVAKLLPMSDKLEYESQVPGITKKPDLLQHLGGIKTQYEITCPELSAEEKERNDKLKHLADEIGNVFISGSLDVYLAELDFDFKTKTQIIEGIKNLNRKLSYTEVDLGEAGLLVYDPKGGIEEDNSSNDNKKILSNGRVIGGCLFGVENDRSHVYRKQLGLKYRSPGIIIFSKSDKPNKFTNFKLLRIFRPAVDNRAFQKVITKSSQLSQAYPSIVVIQLGKPTALIGDWAEIVADAFKSGIYKHPSGVWLRELNRGFDLYVWREILIINHFSEIKVPEELITCIIGKEAIRKIESL